MKVFLMCILLSSPMLAQAEIKNPRLDPTNTKKNLEEEIKEVIHPLGFDFSINNVVEINLLINNLLLSKEEKLSGLTDDELKRYMENKTFLKSLMKLPPNEAEKYPALHFVRQALGAAKTLGAIIILLMSIL